MKPHFALIFAIAFGLCACGKRVAIDPHDVKVLRTYGWDTTVPDPEAEWNPGLYQLVARMPKGLMLLREGSGKSDYFASSEKKDPHFPAWINSHQFVVGPARNVHKLDDGQVVASSDGLMVATIRSDRGLDRSVLSNSGFMPKMWNGLIVAQVANKIVLINDRGKTDEFGEGFYAEPQREGPGICYQETPVFEQDFWTAKPKVGKLVIRWKPGRVSEVPGGVGAKWTADGGVVAVVLSVEPKGTPWWKDGTSAVYLAPGKAKPVPISDNVHDLAPHPSLPLVAAAANDGRIKILSLEGKGAFDFAGGDRPRWSHDGTRLLVEEMVPGKPDARYLKVYVVKIPGLKNEIAQPETKGK